MNFRIRFFLVSLFILNILFGDTQIKVGIYENQPKIFTNENGEISGFWGDITNYLAKEEGWEIIWIHGNWGECLENLERNEIDMLVDVAYSEERSKKYDFQEETVYLSWSVLYINSEEDFSTVLDLKGKKVGALKNSYNLEGPGNFKEMLNKFNLDCTILELEDYDTIFELIDTGELYGGITNKDYGTLHEDQYNVKRTSFIFQPAHIKYAFPKDSELSKELIPIIDKQIKKIKNDKESMYYTTFDKHLGGDEKVRVFPLWLKILLGILMIFALIFFIFFWVLKYEVGQKTRKLEVNIKKLQEMKDELKIMVNRWETTFNSIKDVIMLINLDNEIEEINEAGCLLMEKPKDKLIGEKCYKVFHATDKIPDFCPCLGSLSSGNIESTEIEEKGRFFLATGWPIKDSSGKITGFSHALKDVTERKRSEEELSRYRNSLELMVKKRTDELKTANQQLQEVNSKLREASNLKSQFLANMSHELRSPLNSIIGFTGIMLQGLSGDLDEEQTRQLTMVYESARHLLKLINDILDLSKIEAGKISIEINEMKISDTIGLVSKMISPLVSEKELQFEVDIANDVPEKICSDSNRIKQVLVNLLSNAIKFTDKGLIKLVCEYDKRANQIIYSVEDTGIGIKPEDQDGIFDEFQQIETKKRSKPEGTGLGLPISRRIAHLLGGKIWVESELDKGSKFTFSIPCKLKQHIEVSSKEIELNPQKKLILTIDDDPQSQEILKTHLNSAGYEVLQAYNAQEALEFAKKYNPFAITLDIILPDTDGWTLLEMLKIDPQTNAIPVICVSIMDNKQKGFSLGAIEYLTKPVDSKRLIDELLRLERFIEIRQVHIIDDNRTDALLIKEYLSNYKNFDFTISFNGEEGVKQVKAKRPDLIILDLVMPGVDGFEVVEELKSFDSTKNIPIIIITGKLLDAEERKYLNNRIEGIILKGNFDKENLLNNVAYMIKKIERRDENE